MLIDHEERMLYRLRRDAYQRSSQIFKSFEPLVHSLELTHAKRAPSTAVKADDQGAAPDEIARANQLRRVVEESEGLDSLAYSQGAISNSRVAQLLNHAAVNGLDFCWHVLRDQLLALGIDRAQGADASVWRRFIEGAPFHRRRAAN